MPRRPRTSEPTLPLINIVFLMLVFFLVAAQVARPLDSELNLVKTDDPAIVPPADALVIHADGRTTWRGEAREPSEVIVALQAEGYDGPARILPDRDAPAHAVLAAANALRTAADSKILIVTERALQ
ncbi:ExbD/TolR family protein (plasmid) [Falsihalocynthiibacter sp. SS001]|uniref:ExbD/TolR family protein n=1 Tax=Falsihalocynthiibacter sp. SS001 TaxID=3349698 RepID=UPI0036D25B8C